MIRRAYAQGLIDGLENAAQVVEAYDVGAKHIVSKIQASERKAEVAQTIRNMKYGQEPKPILSWEDGWNEALIKAAEIADCMIDDYDRDDPYCQGICDACFGIAWRIKELKK